MENIKITTHPFYHINFDWFSWAGSKKKNLEKKFKMADKKNAIFNIANSQKKISWNFHRLVLGLIGLIDAKVIDEAQRI